MFAHPRPSSQEDKKWASSQALQASGAAFFFLLLGHVVERTEDMKGVIQPTSVLTLFSYMHEPISCYKYSFCLFVGYFFYLINLAYL